MSSEEPAWGFSGGAVVMRAGGERSSKVREVRGDVGSRIFGALQTPENISVFLWIRLSI